MDQAVEESVERVGHRLLFPHVRKLSELFVRVEPIEDLARFSSRAVHTWEVKDHWGRPAGRALLSSFCSVSHPRPSLNVTPKLEVIEKLGRNMLLVDGYVLNFEIVVRGDGTALVLCKYNRILGSRWLAIIPASEIPEASE